MHAEGNHIGIDEDTGADNAAHDDQGGIEYSEQLARFDGVQESALWKRCPLENTLRRTTDLTGITLP